MLVIMPFFCTGQHYVSDSLQKVLTSLPAVGHSFAADTARVMILCEMGKGKDKNGLFVGEYEQCIGFLEEAEKTAKRINFVKGLVLANMYAGTWHSWKGHILKGLQKKQQAVYYAEIDKQSYWLGRAYRQLGDNYYLLRNYDLSIRFLTKALEPSGQSDPITYLIVTQNLGTSYFGKKAYKQADYWLEKAYFLCKKANNRQLLKYVILNWAEVCIASHNDTALNQLLDEYPSVNFTDQAWDVHYHALNAQRYLRQSIPEKALSELKKGLNGLEKASDQHRQELFLQLSLVYEQLGDSRRALNYYRQYSALWEKDVKEFQQKQTEYLKYEYENQKQQEDIKLLSQDRRMLLAGVVAALLFVVFLVWNNRVLSRKNKLIASQRNELWVLQEQLSVSNQQLVHFNEELEEKIKKRTQELVDANQELTRKNQEIQAAFVSGKTQERKRVASELHDNLGSTLSGLIWQLQSIMPENLSGREQEIYEGLIRQMKEAYIEIRHISHHLLPPELKKGLEAALQQLFNDLNHNRKIHFELLSQYHSNVIAKDKEVELYSICLELINNTLKHSEATKCTLKIISHPDYIALELSDNGRGFDTQSLKARGRGLKNIQERVESLNGEFRIHSVMEKGSDFLIQVPLA
ncbi:putative signal transduction histidine kinase [Runella slithyformis DSM 19594]|uniref:Oxygen sensor histidine kinase NreB n=2 Tax=Runella TaxID=105 RepID=A0A7U3ZM66_RUNSL|nr:putative signal transduction histidine kinase [Runella slithyformis DSM 19594]